MLDLAGATGSPMVKVSWDVIGLSRITLNMIRYWYHAKSRDFTSCTIVIIGYHLALMRSNHVSNGPAIILIGG